MTEAEKIRYIQLTEEGDEKQDVSVDEARKIAEAEMKGKPCPGWDECPIKTPNGKMKKIRKVVKEPRLVMQKKKGKEKREIVTKPEQIDKETEEVISTPEPRTG